MAPLQPLEGDSSKPPVQRRKSSRKAGQGARAPPQAAPDGRRQRRPQRSRSGGDEIRAASPRRAREGHHQHPLAKTAPAPRRERQDHTVKVELSHKSRPFVTFRTVLLFVCGGFAVIFLVLFWSSRSAPAVTRLDPRTWVETCAGSLDVRRLSGSPLGTQAPELGVHLAQYARDLRKGSRAKAFTVLLAGSDASIRSAQKAIEGSLMHCRRSCISTFNLATFSAGSDSTGRLQEAFVSALMGCQGGVFFLEGVGDASGDLLRGPVHTLVGEYGSFMHMGRAVPAAGSVVVLLLRLDGAEAGGESAVRAKIATAASSGEGSLEAKGNALARRIDHVALLL